MQLSPIRTLAYNPMATSLPHPFLVFQSTMPINDPIPVELFLSNFFPNLTEIHSWKYQEHDQQKMWEQVRPFYDLFLTIRKQGME
jgi:hypothetical protein